MLLIETAYATKILTPTSFICRLRFAMSNCGVYIYPSIPINIFKTFHPQYSKNCVTTMTYELKIMKFAVFYKPRVNYLTNVKHGQIIDPNGFDSKAAFYYLHINELGFRLLNHILLLARFVVRLGDMR